MHLESDQIVFSPSDLTQYMDSPFASWMEHLALTNPELLPMRDAEEALGAVLQKKGYEHELTALASFAADGLNVVNLSKAMDAVHATRLAMQAGADVIYQAGLLLMSFKGFADFLIKVQGDSLLGNYHYEILDTKLAKTLKPQVIMQLCCYADLLEAMQGRRPKRLWIMLGDGTKQSIRTEDYFYYYLNLKDRFLQAHQFFNAHQPPDPADSEHWGGWSHYAEELLKQSDHLAQVATMTKSQIKKLHKAGIYTMQALAAMDCKRIKGMSQTVFERLQAQAAMQKESLGHEVPSYKLLPHEAGEKQGLALLPPPSPLDVFFDIEGFPLEEGGLEYLWGVTYFDEQGIRQYKDFWAHNAAQEKEAFMAFIAWVYKRWQQDPNLHIYHYASYEVTACRKLMGRYGVCEQEVDELLRNEVLIDLYKVVKSALILGEPRYSIKNVEHLYRSKRLTDVGTGSDSVVVYEHWRENPDGDTWQTSTILQAIRDYNVDDCNSTQELVDWLRLRQEEQGIPYLGKTEIVEVPQKEELHERLQLRDRLLQMAHDLNAQGKNRDAAIYSMFAWSLEFHRRESKPVFWRLFDRLGLSDEKLLDDLDCLAYCMRTDKPPYKPTPKARHLAYEYSFDPNQEFKGTSEQYYVLGKETADGKPLKVTFYKEDSRLADGFIVLQMKDELAGMITLIPDDYLQPEPIPQAIAKQAEAFERGRLEKSAILDFLQRNRPRMIGHQSGHPIAPSHEPKKRLEQIIHAVNHLDASYLAIQGPPGAGKTYTAKHIIAALLKQGKTIGISSNSHKAINHLLLSTVEYCQREKIKGHFACTRETDESLKKLGVTIIENKSIFQYLQSASVVGTTAWGFARDELTDAFDYLFIDEAGQVSVANLIAMSLAAKNIILMGDQMQLGQPSQGNHPEESGLSILDYLLHATPTIAEDMGIFLGTTYRMHSAINQFISDAIYEGKLESAPENDRQRIQVPNDYEGILSQDAGIITVPVMHEGNTQASDEEIECIVNLTKQLLGRAFTNKDGSSQLIRWEDLLFVAPYNHQVNKLKSALGKQAKVGSVDKFQGQEAPVVFLSMCASNANESPRGLNFLFNKNRMNVAISRAQCMAIIVYSPALLEASAKNVEQLNLINLFCKLIQGHCGK
ncbi:TM0106 family RecB-like putative nuclease [Legionella nagasakiensis]|uniref:TM0106 family RecB-like putative nuclease n=1 Tax=Legionella nagasakiensis TaxID=535290 RepID=UPI0010558F77|nr:TM0106 family RecB-like putative nuclease [Legionella nagasakiensis]